MPPESVWSQENVYNIPNMNTGLVEFCTLKLKFAKRRPEGRTDRETDERTPMIWPLDPINHYSYQEESYTVRSRNKKNKIARLTNEAIRSKVLKN